MAGGIWDTVKGTAKKGKFPSWPKPFNAVERITVLNCHEVMVMRIEFVAQIIGEFSFDAFVPSPFELFRNWVFGQLRCGKKMGIKTKLAGPGSAFLSTGGKVMLAEIGGMIGAPLLVWSVAQSVFNAISTWTTIRNVTAFCSEPEARAIMRDGIVFIKHVGIGGVPGYDVVYDPFDVCTELSGFFDVPEHPIAAWAICTLQNESPSVTASIDVWVELGGAGSSPIKHFNVGPGGATRFSIYAGNDLAVTAQVQYNNFVAIPGVVPFLVLSVQRFMCAWGNPEDPNFGMIGGPLEDGPANPCSVRFADGTPLFPDN